MIDKLLSVLALLKNNPLLWAQGVHFLIGLSVMLMAYRNGARRKYWRFALAVFAWAFIVELWYDPTYEHDPFFWSGALDMACYVLGALCGLYVDAGSVDRMMKARRPTL